MTDRQPIQFFFVKLPLGHKLTDVSQEAIVVVPFQQMDHFVNDNIFKTIGWLFGKFQIDPNAFLFTMLQVPHLVFICLTPQSLIVTPINFSHFSIRAGSWFFSCLRYHSFNILCCCSVVVPGRTKRSRCVFVFISTLGGASCSVTLNKYLLP